MQDRISEKDGDQKNAAIQEKNSNLTVGLIFINLILLLIFLNWGYVSENQYYFNIILMIGALSFLLGGYALSYRGKGYRAGRWLFVASLVLAAAAIGLYLYAAGMAAAFQH
ncbi:hypothetical protein [Pedobacter antarcticus]|uniref:Uncharacterized protein n=2 Tax=Pedobacter antarcticus TaxID=34086 RepID=A0A081PCE4_9SPHI|nr:hypothetical protein [Pedobacter antarcticus]KEQ28367.1 hypothetical protein N180_01665 [Pedobacter antarcticus 4BY]SDL57094.1 hypothetical protein SAMN04488084_101723 [Pedobacter antarcticus]SFF05741.1 hypothetical protein SAMN03003324_02283 [Pedobacter antarcticus]